MKWPTLRSTDPLRTAAPVRSLLLGLKTFPRDPLYSNAVYLMLGGIANALFGFMFWIVAARLYSPGDVGLATAALSAAALLAVLSSFGFGYGMIRFLRSCADRHSLINSSFTAAAMISAIITLVFLSGLGLWSPKLGVIRENVWFFAAFLSIIPVSTVSGLMDQIFVADRKAGFVLAKNLTFNISRLALLAVLALSLRSFGIFASWGIAILAAFLAGLLIFLPRSQCGYRPVLGLDRRALSDIFRFSFMNYLAELFVSAPVYLLPIIVLNVLGAESNAYYYIAWSIGNILNMTTNAITTSLFAEGSNKEEGLEHDVSRSLKMIFFLLIPAVILMLVFADRFLAIFGGSYSKNAANLLRLTALASIPGAVNSVYLSVKRVRKKLAVIIGLTAFSGSATIILSYILLPYAGIAGAGIASLAAQSCIAIVVVAGWLKKSGNMEKGRP